MSQPPVSPHSPSLDNRINALIDSSPNIGKWGGPTGTGVTLTIAPQGPGSSYPEDYSPLLEPARGQGFSVNEAQGAAFLNAAAEWAAVANINLVEVAENGDVTADIRFAYTQAIDVLEMEPGFTFNIFGFAYLPQPIVNGGDIWLDPDVQGFNYNQAPNGNGYFLLLHELGHALLGLTDTTSEAGLNGARLSAAEDNNTFTVMSYNASLGVVNDLENPGISRPTTPMLYDILAAQHIYGANFSHNAGNTSYRYAPGQAIYETIWDGGGIDSLDWSNQETAAFINLNDGEFSNLGPARSDGVNTFANTLAIAFNTVIENGFGGAGNDTISGNEASNGITGGQGFDLLFGQDGNDVMYGNQGADSIYGNTGNDLMYGGQDADIMFGGRDADVMYGNFANDAVYGNLGDDILYGGKEQDALFGGQDQDTLFGNADADFLFGNKGDDVLYGGGGDDSLNGGSGFDTLYGGADVDDLQGGADNDVLFGDEGNDRLDGNDGDDTLYGGDGDDVLDGSNDDDVIFGGDGDDQITGGNDDDTLYGGAGDDNLIANDGADFLYGGEGADVMNGGSGNDTFIVSNQQQTVVEADLNGLDIVETTVTIDLFPNVEIAFLRGPNSIGITGNESNNRLVGNDRGNLMVGGAGNDVIEGGSGADTLDGGADRDILEGGFGDDVYLIDDDETTIIEGTNEGFDRVITSINIALPTNIEVLELADGADEATGNDNANVLIGSNGADLISGRDGADTLRGGAGADTIVGGNGADELTGDGGIDVFLYNSANLGADTITDYEAGVDLFTVDNGVTVVSNLAAGSDAIITLSTGDVITIVGVAPGDIVVEDLN